MTIKWCYCTLSFRESWIRFACSCFSGYWTM